MATTVEIEEDEATEDSDDPEYLTRIFTDLFRLKERFKSKTFNEAFTNWCIRQISPSKTDEQVLTAMADAKLPGVDAVWFDANHRDPRAGIQGTFFLLKSLCPETHKEVPSFSQNDIDAFLKTARLLVKDLGEQQTADGVPKLFFDHYASGYPIKFIVALGGRAKAGLRTQANRMEAALRDQHDDRLSFELYDLEIMFNKYIARLEAVDMGPPKRAVFQVQDNVQRPGMLNHPAIVAQISLLELHRLVGEHELSLFAKNLRVPIVSSRYNKGIRDVMQQEGERQNFWYFNNGLTAVCERFEVRARPDDPEGLTTVTADGLQIVNGCQTSMTVYDEIANWRLIGRDISPFEKITVMLRVLEIPSAYGDTTRLAHKVAQYTNSQTPITGRDLHATDAEQGALKDTFRTDWRIFLEVKRDEWKRRLEADPYLRHSYEFPNVISNEKAGQHFVAFWQGEPAFAKSQKKQIFENEDRYQSIFGLRNSPEALLVPSLAAQLLDQWKRDREYNKRKNGGHRASKADVVKHGELYLLAMFGAATRRTLGAPDATKADSKLLRVIADNLRKIHPKYNDDPKGALKTLLRNLEKSFDANLQVLAKHVQGRLSEDPELTVRNLMVRPSTMRELEQDPEARRVIDDTAQLVGPLLKSPQ